MMRRAWPFIVLAALISLLLAAVVGLRGARLVLALDEDVSVLLQGKLPLRVAFEQQVDVHIAEEIQATVKLGRLQIPIDETLEVPLDFKLRVALDAPVMIDEKFDIAMDVPIDTVLTERELDLSQLAIPIDTDIYVDDVIAVDIVVPVDTKVETLLGVVVPVKVDVPVKAKIPIRQKLRVRDTIKLNVKKLRVPLRMKVPVRTQLPLKQSIRVQGTIDVPVRRRLSVPIKQVMTPDMRTQMPVTVQLDGNVPARLNAVLDTEVTIDQAIPTRLGEIVIDSSEVRVERRPRK